jgi:beta-ribofuranosylaminobenzene 5'-phosphate synthase
MIDAPGIELIAEPAASWSIAGPLADRIQETLQYFQERQARSPMCPETATPARIQVVSAPADHIGLGVGTQLSLAVVRVVLKLAGCSDPSVETLAELSGRGRRSGIGLHGFLHGGLIVDGGRRDENRPPPLVAHVPFPEDWSVLVLQPPGPRGRHGPDELRAFSDLPPLSERITERLCRLVLLGILPAVAERDLSAFGQALVELQNHVGSAFSPLQGGLYASPESEALIAELTRLGLVGAGQSSWGPTIYAFGAISESDRINVTSRLFDRWGLPPSAILWTRAANHGSVLDREET